MAKKNENVSRIDHQGKPSGKGRDAGSKGEMNAIGDCHGPKQARVHSPTSKGKDER